AREHAKPGRQPIMHEERRRSVGAEADIERMPDREQADIAHHDVPGLAQIGREQHQDHDGDDIAAAEDRQRQQDREQGAESEDRTAAHAARPSSPCGRASRTKIRSPKLNMLLSEGSMKKPASASEAPTSNPPMSAPGMLPSPPRITIMKASSV